ncbi:MAG: PAS domain S-box protein, partial [Chloroflexi bacterium]|nr:PAS domain S-box protein [Chloroflexota bacterium]
GLGILFYIIARTRFHWLVPPVLVWSMTIILLYANWAFFPHRPPGAITLTIWFLGAIVFAFLLFSTRTLTLIVAVILAGTGFAAIYHQDVGLIILWNGLLTFGALVVVAAAIRDRYQRQLDQATRDLETSREHYKIISALFSDYAIGLRAEAPGRLIIEWALGLETLLDWVPIGLPLDPDAIIPPEHRAKVDTILAQLLNGERVDGELPLQLPPGTLWVQFTARPEHDPQTGQVTHIYGALRDITAKREAEQARIEAEIRYKQLFDEAVFGIYRTTFAGAIIDVNPALAQILGYESPEQFKAEVKNANDLYRDPQQRRDHLTLALDSTARQINEVQLKRRDGQPVWVTLDSRTVRDESGQIIALEGMMQDITQRKQAEAQRLELARERERVLVLERFLSQAAHDLRTPLATMGTSLYLLRRSLGDDPGLLERMTTLDTQVAHINNSLDNLLKMSQLERLTLKLEQVDLNALIQALIDQGLEPSTATDQQIVFVPDAALPMTLVDPVEIRFVLRQLLMNASAHSAPHDRITVTTQQAAEWIVIMVQDEGEGIAEADQAQIFEPFYRSAAREVDKGGIGLGLTIAQWLIRAHDGQITVDSEAGVGTTFQITLPLKRASLRQLSSNGSYPDHAALAEEGFETLAATPGQPLWAARTLDGPESVYQLLAEHSSDILALQTPEGRYLYVSPSIERLTGWQPQEWMALDGFEFVHPDDGALIIAALRDEALKGQISEALTFRLQHKQGGYIWMEGFIRPVLSAEGEVQYLVTTARDITARKTAEDALRRSEARTRSIIESLAEGVIIIEADGRYSLVNASAERIVGMPIGTMEANTLHIDWRAIHPDGTHFHTDEYSALITLHTGEPQTNVVMGVLRGQHERVWLSVNTQPIFADDGTTVTGVVATFTDITERFQAQAQQQAMAERLQRQMQMLTQVLSSTPDYIAMLDNDQRFIYVNPAKLAALNLTLADMLGRTWHEIPLSAMFGQLLQPLLDKVIANSEAAAFEAPLETVDGVRRFDCHLAPLLNEPGRVAAVVMTSRDITPYKQLESELRATVDRERELNQMRDRFLSILAHEFRNPLAMILSAVEMMQRYHDRLSDDQRREYLARIADHVQHLSAMSEDATSLSYGAAPSRLQLAPLDLVVFCGQFIGEMAHTHPNHQLTLHHATPAIPLVSDTKLLRQILFNLLSNAIKYSPAGGRVDLYIAQQDGVTTLKISDCGIGIPPEAQPHIFNTFFRAENVGNLPGTGLGLSVVKQSVESLGGTITLVSSTGAGTTFAITLPSGTPFRP